MNRVCFIRLAGYSMILSYVVIKHETKLTRNFVYHFQVYCGENSWVETGPMKCKKNESSMTKFSSDPDVSGGLADCVR